MELLPLSRLVKLAASGAPAKDWLLGDRCWNGRDALAVATWPSTVVWFAFMSFSRCVPLFPKYPTITDVLLLTCCWMFRFQDWTLASLKLGSTQIGAIL